MQAPFKLPLYTKLYTKSVSLTLIQPFSPLFAEVRLHPHSQPQPDEVQKSEITPVCQALFGRNHTKPP